MNDILDTLKSFYQQRGDDIERWLAEKRKDAEPFFYTSVDLRHSGPRLVPVDTNLFPAGFNNLSPRARARASRFIARFLEENHPKTESVLIIPENHTRNLYYLDNLATLLAMFEAIGIEAKLGSLAAAPGQPIALVSQSGHQLTEYPLKREGDRLMLENGYAPDLVILNNDMTSGEPEILQNLKQPVLPPADMGWHSRKKSTHFDMYCGMAREFGKAFDFDPWLICAEFHHCGLVDFKEQTGLERVAEGIERVLKRARKKHKEYGIKEEPYVFVKADSGTYGMGIMTARSGGDILDLNKKERNKMQAVKEGARVSTVLIQEGIHTIDRVEGKPAEPMVYMIDGVPIGGMWRVNAERDAESNLNAAGMSFTGMCDEVEDECGQWKAVEDCHFQSFGLIAALAALAAARENYDSFMLNL